MNEKQLARNEMFEKAPIKQAVWKIATPMIMSMLVTVFYNMADTFFIGQTGDTLQVSAVSLAMPLFFILMACGNLFGNGGSSAISRALGAGESHRVKNISSFCFYSVIGVGIVVGASILIFMDKIVILSGAKTAQTMIYVEDYLKYIAIGAPFVMMSNAFGAIVRSEGAAKEAMVGMMLGTITNIVLDPIMILYMDMGVAGAAIATVIGNAFACVYYVVLLNRPDTVLSLKFSDYALRGGVATSVFIIGIPGALNNVLMSSANLIYNSLLSNYGDAPVAALGISTKVVSLIVMILLGLCLGSSPLIGYSYGANNYGRMREVIKYELKCAILFCTSVVIIFYFSAEILIQIFINDAEVIDYGIRILRAQIVCLPLLGVVFVAMSSVQAMGKGLLSLILSICRQGLVFIPAVILCDMIGGLDLLIYAQAISDFVSICLSAAVLIWIFRKYK